MWKVWIRKIYIVKIAFTKDFSKKERQDILEEFRSIGIVPIERDLVLFSLDAPAAINFIIELSKPFVTVLGTLLAIDFYNALKKSIKKLRKNKKEINTELNINFTDLRIEANITNAESIDQIKHFINNCLEYFVRLFTEKYRDRPQQIFINTRDNYLIVDVPFISKTGHVMFQVTEDCRIEEHFKIYTSWQIVAKSRFL